MAGPAWGDPPPFRSPLPLLTATRAAASISEWSTDASSTAGTLTAALPVLARAVVISI